MQQLIARLSMKRRGRSRRTSKRAWQLFRSLLDRKIVEFI